MQPIGSQIVQWETQICRQIKQKEAELCDGKEIRASAQSKDGEEINRIVTNILVNYPQFPTSPHGSRFIKSTCTVCPKVVVAYSDLKLLITEGLLPKEICKYIEVPALRSSRFGTFTERTIRLELTNIVFPERSNLIPNPPPEEESDYFINSHTTFGEIRTDPNLKLTQIRATVTFGDFHADDQIIEVETTDDDTMTNLIISLSHLNVTGKISHEGNVSLQNNHVFSMDDILDKPVTWYKVKHECDCQLTI